MIFATALKMISEILEFKEQLLAKSQTSIASLILSGTFIYENKSRA